MLPWRVRVVAVATQVRTMVIVRAARAFSVRVKAIPLGSRVFTGTSSGWFRGRVREDSLCTASVEHQVRLEVPAGVDYDLYLHKGSCGSRPSSSVGGAGADETLTVSEGDSFGSDDDFGYYVEVRYVSGASCAPWTLRFYGHDC